MYLQSFLGNFKPGVMADVEVEEEVKEVEPAEYDPFGDIYGIKPQEEVVQEIKEVKINPHLAILKQLSNPTFKSSFMHVINYLLK